MPFQAYALKSRAAEGFTALGKVIAITYVVLRFLGKEKKNT